MSHITVKVVNKLGAFEGKIKLAANATKEDADTMMRGLIGGINTINALSLEHDDGSATVFGESTLRESVITVSPVI